MKQLKCEVCGSSEMTKRDDQFVCDYCGAKYELAEVQKMVVSGTLEVSGKIKIDKTDEIKGNLQLASDYYSDGRYYECTAILEGLVKTDPSISDIWYLYALVAYKTNYSKFKTYESRGLKNNSKSYGIMTLDEYRLIVYGVDITYWQFTDYTIDVFDGDTLLFDAFKKYDKKTKKVLIGKHTFYIKNHDTGDTLSKIEVDVNRDMVMRTKESSFFRKKGPTTTII